MTKRFRTTDEVATLLNLPERLLAKCLEPLDMIELLKYRENPEHKAYANDEDLQLIANYKKVPIVLYNNVYEKVKVFEPCGEINQRSDRMLK